MPLPSFRKYFFTTKINGSYAFSVIFSLSLLCGSQSKEILFTYVIYDVVNGKVNNIFYMSAYGIIQLLYRFLDVIPYRPYLIPDLLHRYYFIATSQGARNVEGLTGLTVLVVGNV